MFQRVQYSFEHSRVVSSTQKNVRALDCVSCSKIFLHAGNNPVVLRNNAEHAETLFIALIEHIPGESKKYSRLMSLKKVTIASVLKI